MDQSKTLMIGGLAIITSVLLMSLELPSAFADEQVSVTEEATNRDCYQNDSCYSKSAIIINPGQTVTWLNEDYTMHSVKSGSQNNGVNGIFASDMIMPGDSFSHTFTQSGMFNYYCPSHPWMNGVVYVK